MLEKAHTLGVAGFLSLHRTGQSFGLLKPNGTEVAKKGPGWREVNLPPQSLLLKVLTRRTEGRRILPIEGMWVAWVLQNTCKMHPCEMSDGIVVDHTLAIQIVKISRLWSGRSLVRFLIMKWVIWDGFLLMRRWGPN